MKKRKVQFSFKIWIYFERVDANVLTSFFRLVYFIYLKKILKSQIFRMKVYYN